MGTMTLLNFIGSLEGLVVCLALLWLGGILLCATPYLWALCCTARSCEPRQRINVAASKRSGL